MSGQEPQVHHEPPRGNAQDILQEMSQSGVIRGFSVETHPSLDTDGSEFESHIKLETRDGQRVSVKEHGTTNAIAQQWAAYEALCLIKGEKHTQGMLSQKESEEEEKEETPSDFETLYNMLKFKDLRGKTIVSRYHVLNLLGIGGMGDVYKAEDQQSGQIVALKRLIPPAKLELRMELEKRFDREVTYLQAVSSPYVVRLHDSFRQSGYFYLVMEYIDGKSLESLVKEAVGTSRQFSILEMISIMSKVARGLEAIHTAGIIHRDLKPANIMVNRLQGIVKILDLGLACHSDYLGMTTGVAGTVSYMSPEQVSGHHKELTPQSDIFSLGTTFYYLLTGQLPFQGGGVQCLIQICEANPPAPCKVNPEIPQELSQLIERAMAKIPDARYPNASALAQILDDLRLKLLTHYTGKVSVHSILDLSETSRLSPAELYFLQQISNLSHTRPGIRRSTCYQLAKIQDCRAAKALISMLADPVYAVRAAAVESLGNLGNMNAVEPLKELLRPGVSPLLRRKVEKSLRKLLEEEIPTPGGFWRSVWEYLRHQMRYLRFY